MPEFVKILSSAPITTFWVLDSSSETQELPVIKPANNC